MNGQFDLGQINPIHFFYGFTASLGLVFALIMPDGEMSLGSLIVQWQLQTFVIISLLLATHISMQTALPRLRQHPWITTISSGVVGSLLFTPLGVLIDGFFEGPSTSHFLAEMVDEWQGAGPPVMVCWVLLNLPWLLGYKLFSAKATVSLSNDSQNIDEHLAKQSPPSPAANDEHHSLPESTRQPAFLSEHSNISADELIYIKSELHYLNIVGSQGKQLILFSLAEAVKQLSDWDPEATEGQVHRSYWVNKKCVKEFRRKGRQAELLLSNSDVVPVSRNNVVRIKEWLN